MIYLVTYSPNLIKSDEYLCITVQESLNILEPLRVVGIDTETQGLDPYSVIS